MRVPSKLDSSRPRNSSEHKPTHHYENADAMSVEKLQTHLTQPDSSSSSTVPLQHRFEQTLASCSQSIEAGDFNRPEALIAEVVDLLNSIPESIAVDPENEELQKSAYDILSEIHRCICLPSLDQALIDALSFELPKVVARFSCVSNKCLEIAQGIVNQFVETCSPRDMVSVLCEALASPSDMFQAPGFFIPLLSGLAKALACIQRRPFENVKAAVPIVLNILEAMSSEPDNDETDLPGLFDSTICIANSLQAICEKMEGKDKEKLSALLGLFVLQIMALASISMGRKFERCFHVVLQLSHFLRNSGLSCLGLITGCEVDIISEIISEDDGCEYMNCFSFAKHGAALAVIWSHMSNEAAVAYMADLGAVKEELQNNQTKRWQAVGMLMHIFACVNLSWELKKQAIDFLLCIEGNLVHKDYDGNREDSDFMPSLYSSLQAVQMVVMYASDAALRKKAFDAFKKVLADVPILLRFDILIALIKNSEVSSMIAILLGCVKDEMHVENRSKASVGNGVIQAETNTFQIPSFWRAEVLDLVEWVLRPPKGGPPSLPDYSDAVLSALNLYRYVLITECSENTNYTGVRSKEKLEKAYSQWLQPLQTVVSGIAAKNQMDDDELAVDIQCAFNPLELVLYRCIELVEENLKH